MSLTDREAALELRGRYIRLLDELRRTRDHNPETLEAFERILRPEALSPYLAQPRTLVRVVPSPASPANPRHVAA